MNRIIAMCAGLWVAAFVPVAAAAEPIEFGGLKWHQENTDKFSLKDGMLVLNKGRGWLRSDREYDNFVLHIEWMFIDKGADSGIFVRTGKESGGGNGWPTKAIQIQFMDNESFGAVFADGAVTKGVKRKAGEDGKPQSLVKKLRKPTGELNVMEIRCQGKNLEVKLNGEVITTADTLAPEKGYIGLQGEGGTIHFKKVEVKEIKE
jgi:hypothetical protein